jgi:modulator of FtsH protease
VTTAYAPADWANFGLATAGTAATLAGLLFVAVSVNLKRILEFASLPARAGQTLILFATPLITGIFLLVPGQSDTVLGCEFAVTGVSIGAIQLIIDARSVRSEQETPVTWLLGRVLPAIVSCGCLAAAGVTLLAQAGGGFYWLVPSVLAAIAFGLVNIWVLLVEILR